MADHDLSEIDPTAAPSGDGCVECLEHPEGWWVHLRRCTACGHVGCCDSSPAQHATAHFRATGHPVIASYEPGESWCWDYRTETIIKRGPELAAPTSRPDAQGSPAPADRVPENWLDLIHR
jgi:hypothetical protein